MLLVQPFENLMPNRFQQSLTGVRFCFLFFLMVTLSAAGRAQTESAEHDAASSDALTYLSHVLGGYAQASSYHIESVEETRMTSEFHRSWNKTLTTAIMGLNNQYRFEVRSEIGCGLQVSNGKTEWIYYPPFGQYVQQLAPGAGPSHIQSRAAIGLSELLGAQRATKAISQLLKLVGTARYAPDESLEVNGKSFACTVVKTEGELPGKSRITTSLTFWIDKRSNVIRKFTERREGPLLPSRADVAYDMEREVVFTATDLDAASFPEGVFTLRPPMTAALVKDFEDPLSAGVGGLVGKQAPDVNFKGVGGEEVSLRSFQGKAVLLDFWACLSSMFLSFRKL
jgi:hypothetical protein